MVSPGYFRFFLAAVVFLHHSSRVSLGIPAVYIFFMLSGYWIYRMWHGEYKYCAGPYLTFLISRIWRLLPVFIFHSILFLSIFAALKPFPDVSNIWDLLHFAVSHIVILGYANLGTELTMIVPAWSLDIELQFYIIAPLLMAGIAARSEAAKKAKILLLTFSGVGVGILVFNFALDIDVVQTQNIAYFLIFFLIGAAAADQNFKPSRRFAQLSAGASILFIVAMMVFPETRGIVIGGAERSDVYALNISFSVIVAFLAAPLAIATCQVKSSKIDRHLGNLSYVFYLNHWVGAFLLGTFYGHLPTLERLPFFIAAWIAVFVASVIIYVAVDRPAESLRRRFVHSRRVGKV